jgi:hypothetical protein
MEIRTRSRFVAAGILFIAITAIVALKLSASPGRTAKAAQQDPLAENRLAVHEWGTFTSIAGKNGVALEWRPLNDAIDLPQFVHSIARRDDGSRHLLGKSDMRTLIRMETPVVYFYSDKEMEVSVKVDFPQGKITEWYPHVRDVNPGINWGRISVMPGATLPLPVDNKDSHYYPARETDAAVVRVCGTNGVEPQQEKFLFYRGVGNFALPVSARLEGKRLVLKNTGQYPISHLIVFENRGGHIGYRRYDAFSGELWQDRPALDQDLNSLLQELRQILVASGLYEKEAAAMIKTWRDSWFEPGLRIFYVLPRQTTDEVLPLTIEPRPGELVRVLVGRAEVITPEMERSVQTQVSLLGHPSVAVRQVAMQTIRNYGRFSEPILNTILESERDGVIRKRLKQLIAARAPQSE